MAEVSGNKISLDLKLGQVAETTNPEARLDMQNVINALHILAGYASSLEQALIGTGDGTGDPATTIPFRDKFIGVAMQSIAVGNIISMDASGKLVNGVRSSEPAGVIEDPAATIGSTGTRDMFGVEALQFYVAITAAEPGEAVEVGVGPGVLKVTGVKSGKLVWAVDSRSIYTVRAANSLPQVLQSRTLVGNGSLFLDNVTETFSVPGVTYNWEGFWLPGFPYNSGGFYNYNRAFLYPIGVGIADDYALISDWIRSDSADNQIIT